MMRILVLLMLILLSSPFQGEGRQLLEEVELKRYGIGNQQSPINIQTADVQSNNDLGTLKMEYLPAIATLNNLGHEIQVAWSGYAGNVEIEGVKYFLKQCHWHHPSEHTIDGTQYPLELHMVHQSDDDHIAVIGIIYNLGDANYFLTTLEDAIDEVKDAEVVNLGDVDPNNIGLGSNAAYYRYNGSLTTPPYTEGVIWTVIKQVSTVTEQQVDRLREALHGENNSRAVQPLNGRIVELFEHIGIDVMYSSVISEAERAILSWSS